MDEKNSTTRQDKVRIITIDSDWRVTQIYEELITQNGKFKLIFQSDSGLEAQKICKKFQPEVIMLARNIKDIKDTDLLKILLKDCPTSCVVMVYSSDETEWITKVHQLGGRFFLAKPLFKDDLYEIIYGAYEFSKKLKELHQNK